MLDIHLPHGKLHDIKEFFLHLFTITVGLFIALSLEGLVEYEHHRHLAHEAEDSLRSEIANNAKEMEYFRQQIKVRQKQLQTDQDILAGLRIHPGTIHGMSLGVQFEGFDDISWKTAQNTGAVAYMPRKDAQTFSEIYTEQDILFKVVWEFTEEMANSTSLPISHPDDWIPSPAQIDIETDRIGRMQVRLIQISSAVDQLDKTYQEFEAEHR